jgi:hypothetical protein
LIEKLYEQLKDLSFDIFELHTLGLASDKVCVRESCFEDWRLAADQVFVDDKGLRRGTNEIVTTAWGSLVVR